MTDNIIIRYKSWKFILSITIILIILISYFIKIPLNSGGDYIIYSSLLGIIILYNPFILAFYILIAVILFVKSIQKQNAKH